MILVKPSFKILTPINGKRIMKLIELAGRTCYKSEGRITTDSAEKFCKMLLERNHQSVIEHASISVKFIVPRYFTHELVRHRLASYSQESTRYCRYNAHITFILPTWCQIQPGTYEYNAQLNTGHLPSIGWAKSMWESEFYYDRLLSHGLQPQEAREVLPLSLKTEIVTTANLREWIHIFELRTAATAHPQMREIMIPLLKVFQSKLPVFFGHINHEEKDKV